MSTSRPRQRFDPSVNYYQVLDVPFGAAPEDVTRAYRKLMRITHPDRFTEPHERAKAEERAKLINAAYTVLSKPDIRREYDALMRTRVMSDTLMQRYTGNAPGRSSQERVAPRPPSARAVREQRKASSAATLQILFVTGLFVITMAVAIATVVLAYNALTSLV